MDVEALRTEAIEETAQVFLKRLGYVPDQGSDEWEDEYRRQFALARNRRAAKPPGDAARGPSTAGPSSAALPEPTGPPSEARWAVALRAQRLKEISSPELRAWLASAWLAAKDWMDTRELSPAAFQRRIAPQYAEHQKRLQAERETHEAELRAKAEAAAAHAEKLRAAGVTAQGLIDLIDVSPRAKEAALRAKLTDIHAGERRLRVFETADPAALLVIESGAAGRVQYAIERDEGLVADLKLFGAGEPAEQTRA